jgi:RimJ/RimL family protein N-acetyltransferase
MKVDIRRGINILLLIIIILCVFAIAVIFIHPDSSNFVEILGIAISAIIGVTSLFFVIKEYKRARNIEEGQFLFNLNQAFIDNEDLKYVYDKIYRESKDPSLHLIEDKDVTKIVSYLTFLETFWTMYTRRIITIEMIDDLFANRFFMMVTNPNVQKLKLVKEYAVYQNIRKLEFTWRQHRIDHNRKNLYEHNSLNKAVAIKVAEDFFYENESNKIYRFKKLDTTHLDDIVALQDEAIRGLGHKKLLYCTSKEEFGEIIETKRNICLGVFLDNQLVGYGFFTFPDPAHFLVYRKRFIFPSLHKRNMYFKVVVVKEAHRNKGIQSAFLKAAKEYASYYGIKRIVATVHPENTVSCHVFEKTKFRLIKTTLVHDNEPRHIYEYSIKHNQ